jgi:hypothetical protein
VLETQKYLDELTCEIEYYFVYLGYFDIHMQCNSYIYINDLPHNLQNAETVLYADDTTIMNSDEHRNSLTNKINISTNITNE